jgi:catechol 2,3-dioxygenase-like lactoylglutathione lyase family enzyme
VIKGLHHNAYRCRNSEETRAFYEDFLGLPLSGALAINETKSGRQTKVLHTFFRMDEARSWRSSRRRTCRSSSRPNMTSICTSRWR